MYIDIFIYVYKLALHNTTNTRRIHESEHYRTSPARLATSQIGLLKLTSSSPLKQTQTRRRQMRSVMEVQEWRSSPTPSNNNINNNKKAVFVVLHCYAILFRKYNLNCELYQIYYGDVFHLV